MPDLVLTPDVAQFVRGPRAQRMAQASREVAAARRRGGVLHALRNRLATRAGARVGQQAGSLLRSMRGATAPAGEAASAGRFAASLPGLAVMAAALAGIAAIREATGQNIEGLGQQINDLWLGDLDEEARAKMEVRERFVGDRDLMRIVSQTGKISPTFAAISKGSYDLAMMRQRGATAIRRAFPVDSWLDALLLRGVKALRDGWRAASGDAAVQRLGQNYGDQTGNPAGAGTAR